MKIWVLSFILLIGLTFFSCKDREVVGNSGNVEGSNDKNSSQLIFKEKLGVVDKVFGVSVLKGEGVSLKSEAGFLESANDPDGDKIPSDGDGSGVAGDNPCKVKGDKECCYTSSDCDDGDPKTIDKCIPYKDGVEYYQCEHKADPDYCSATENTNCDDGNICTKDACCVGGSVIGGDSSLDCSGVGDNRCVHVKDLSCCESNDDCVKNYALQNPGGDKYKLHICCGGDGVDIAGNSESACNGKGKNQCVHVNAEGYCENAEDCKPNPPGKKCLTAYCVNHVCRYGPPKEDGCCEKDLNCDDNNFCTIDSCKDLGDGKGICVHEVDPSKPDCCNRTDECCNPSKDCDPATDNCCLEGCTKIACSYSAQKGYKICKTFDLKKIIKCCENDSECDDGNVCTLDMCSKSRCRHVKLSDDCCINKYMCPNDGDVCAEVLCSASNKCELKEDVGSCTVSLPYVQKFDMNKSFYNTYTKLSVIGMSSSDFGVGDYHENWVIDDSASYLGSDLHLRFKGAGVGDGVVSCAFLPVLKVVGKKKISLRLEYSVESAGVMGGLNLKAYIMGVGESLGDGVGVTIAENITTSSGAQDKTVEFTDKLDFGTVKVAICVEGDTSGKLKLVDIDNIKVVGGEKPVITDFIGDQTVSKGESRLFTGIKFKELDGSNVKMYLIGAPGFVSVTNFNFEKVDGITVGSGDISIVNASCGGSNSYEISVVVDDGFLVDVKSFTLTVTGCN